MTSDVADVVRKYFRYLFDDYGYTISLQRDFPSFGNWVILLESQACGRIKIMQDREEVYLAMGPKSIPHSWEEGPWYSFDVVVEYLSNGKDRFLSTTGSARPQLERLANRLRSYIGAACELFHDDVFEAKRDELDALRQNVEDEGWDRLFGKGKW